MVCSRRCGHRCDRYRSKCKGRGEADSGSLASACSCDPGMALFLPGMRRWVQEEAANILVPGMALLTAGLFWVLHIWTNRRRCDAYSENTQINTAIHVRERRMWAWIWLVGTYTSLIGMGEILWQISRKGYLDVVDTIICVIFSMAGGLFILAAILWMMKSGRSF